MLLLFTEINISDILTISFVIISVVISVGTICLLCCWGRSKKYDCDYKAMKRKHILKNNNENL